MRNKTLGISAIPEWLRIPIRGYEVMAVAASTDGEFVTNPYKGL